MRRVLLFSCVLMVCWLPGCGQNSSNKPSYPQQNRNTQARPPYRRYQPPRQPPVAAQRGPGRPSESWYPRSAPLSNRWTTVVIHHSATQVGNAAIFDKGHRDRGWDELGYHFVIGNGTSTPDGAIEVGSRWHKQKHGAHCKTPSNYYNDHGIGICLVGDFTKGPPSQRQMASLERLVRFLSYSCRIPTEKVTTHGGLTGKTQCPGRYFALAPLRRALTQPPMASSMP